MVFGLSDKSESIQLPFRFNTEKYMRKYIHSLALSLANAKVIRSTPITLYRVQINAGACEFHTVCINNIATRT
jgi:hypothetical protein